MTSRLRDLIRAVRQSKTAQQERDVVAKESAALRQSFKDPDPNLRHRNVTKLMYIHMLGYPTHFGQMETLKLIAHSGFPDKRIGYLGLMILLDERQEVLMLVTNSIKQDLNQRNPYIAGLALTALGNISSAEMSRDLAPDVLRLMNASNAYIRKKAALCAGRIVRKVPELMEDFLDKPVELLHDRNHGVLLAGVTLMLELCEAYQEAIEVYRKEVSVLCKILKNLLTGGVSLEHDVSGISDPFLQVKVLRLLRYLGKGSAEASDQMSDILAQVASNTESNRNAGYAILYECVQTIMEIESIGGLRVLAINILGRFLSNRDNNIRYVALETLAKVVTVDTAAVQRHRNTVVECVKDADVSIRRRALQLVYALVNENNIKTLTSELLEYLEVCDQEFKADLTAQICLLVQRFAPDKRWYIDNIAKVLVQAGPSVQEEVVRALVVTVSNAPELQAYTVRLLYRCFTNSRGSAADSLQLATLWCLGEYGELLLPSSGHRYLPDEEPVAVSTDELVSLVEGVVGGKTNNAQLRAYALTTLIKLSARLPSQVERIKQDIQTNSDSIMLEVQQRACEYSNMFKYPMRSQLVEHIPALDESSYSRNLTDQAVVDRAPAARTEEELKAAGLENGATLKAATGPDLLDLLSLDEPVPSSSAPAAPQAAPPVVDLLGDLLATAPPPQAAVPQAGSEAGAFNPLGDILGVLPANPSNGIAPSAAPPSFSAWDKHGVNITFTLAKPPGQPSQTRITATYTNSNSTPVTDFILQAAVPKFMQLKLEPASGSVLPANRGGVITQVLLVNNTLHGQKPLVMRLRLTFTVNGSQVVEQGEVSNFPANI